MSPRDVQAPEGALAWLEGSGRMPSRWLYAEDQVATLRTMGAYVLDVREVDGRRVVPGITGYVDAAEFMALRADLDGHSARLDGLEVRLKALDVRLDALEARLDALRRLMAEWEAQAERRDLAREMSRPRSVLDEPVQRPVTRETS